MDITTCASVIHLCRVASGQQRTSNYLVQWFSATAVRAACGPKHPLCGAQQSFTKTNNISCNRLRSAINKNVSIDLYENFFSAAL